MDASSKTQNAGAVRSALIGVFFAADAIGHCLALATICFGGALTAGLGIGTGLFLFGSALATFFLFRFGRLPIAFGIAQDTTISILAPVVIMAATTAVGPSSAKMATALAVIGLSTVLTGLTFWGVGKLGFGRVVRMFPFPVAAGFLASSGYLLVFAGFAIVTHSVDLQSMAASFQDPKVLMNLLPALIMAILLLLAIRFIGGTLPVLVIILVFLTGFYGISIALGYSADRLIDLGLLPRVATESGAGLSVQMFAMIDWQAVLYTLPVLAAVVFLNLLGMLLNTSGVELATRGDIDENHELRVAGLGNILIGGFGGLTSYLQGGASIILAKMGVYPPATVYGYVSALMVGAFMAPLIVAVVPVFIPAALVMFIGLSMLQDWLWATRKRLVLADWLIVFAIVLATAVVGIMAAIGIGFGLAILGFALASFRLPIIRHSTSVRDRRSVRDRNTVDAESLQREGHRLRILHLQGALFFGSVEQMIQHLRGLLATVPSVHSVILDFSEVRSFDSSACAALEKLYNFLRARQIATHMSGVSPGLHQVFQRWGLPIGGVDAGRPDAWMILWPRLEEAIEHCEDDLLGEVGLGSTEAGIRDLFQNLGRNHPRLDDLFAAMHLRTLSKGAVLIQAKERSADIYVVKSGLLGVLLPNVAGPSVRVRAMGAGAIVGEIAYLTGLPRSADVVCEEETSVYCLSEPALRRIEAEDSDLAALIMAIFSRSLAAKLDQTNGVLTYIQRTRN